MKPIVKNREITSNAFDRCHDGTGTLFCKSLLDAYGQTDFAFMHCDTIPRGVSIGEHPHTENEEIYFLVSGCGILTYDGEAYEMEPGDISLCQRGHTHGYLAAEDSVLIVVA